MPKALIKAPQLHPEIQTIRGLACLLLVTYHAVGPGADSGMRLPTTTVWHEAVATFDFIRMPLFAAVAGFVYALRRTNPATFSSFWKKKSIRVVVPLLFATGATLIMRRFAYGVNESISEAFFFHYQQFWFLQAILIIFLVVSTWDRFLRPSLPALGAVGATCVLLAQFPLTNFLSISGAVYLAPYFVVGMILCEKPSLWRSRTAHWFAIPLVTVVTLLHQAGLAGLISPLERSSIPAVACSAASCVIVFRFLPSIRLLEFIGKNSFAVFLWHSAAGAMVRIGVSPLDLPTPVLLLILITAGIMIPSTLRWWIARLPGCSVLFCGEQAIASHRQLRLVDRPRVVDLHSPRPCPPQTSAVGCKHTSRLNVPIGIKSPKAT